MFSHIYLLQIYNIAFTLLITHAVPKLSISLTWVSDIGTCTIDLASGGWTEYLPLVLLIPFLIITVTTIATFIYTRFILKKNLERHKQTLNTINLEMQKNIYSERIKNLIGIFGLLLISNFLFFLPFLSAVIAAATVGLNRVPSQLSASGFVFHLFSNVMNPVIQAWFIKDLVATLKGGFCKFCVMFRSVRGCGNEEAQKFEDNSTTTSENERTSSFILTRN